MRTLPQLVSRLARLRRIADRVKALGEPNEVTDRQFYRLDGALGALAWASDASAAAKWNAWLDAFEDEVNERASVTTAVQP